MFTRLMKAAKLYSDWGKEPEPVAVSDTFNHGATTISISPRDTQKVEVQPEAATKRIEQELIRIGTKLDAIAVLIGTLIIIVLFRGC